MKTLEPLTALSILAAVILFCFFIAAIYIYLSVRKNLPESVIAQSDKITDDTDYWKVVKGEVTESKLDYKDSKGLFSKTKRLYRAHFAYEYYAYDKKYTHSSLLLTWTSSKEVALNYVNLYPRGTKVVVRFHPEHPETSIMEVIINN
jgi:hypothetical protein